MTKAPPIPPDQRSARDPHPDLERALHSGRKSDARARNPDGAEGEQTNRRENTAHARNVQDR